MNWLDRSFLKGPHLALVESQEEYDAALKDFGIEDKDAFCPDNCKMVTHTFRKGGDLIALIGVHPDAWAAADPVEVASMFCHESVHVWQRFVDETCLEGGARDGYGREGEAYAIQNISYALMKEFATRLQKRKS